MRLNKFILIVFIFVLNQFNTQAQEWGRGQIITENNDTLIGEVATASANNFHKICFYRLNDQTEKQIYEINKIHSILFDNGQMFESRELKTNKRKGLYLVETLLKGIVNLYYFEYIDSTKYQNVEKIMKEKGSSHFLENNTESVGVFLAEIKSKQGLTLEIPIPQNDLSNYVTKKRNEQMVLMIFDQHPEMIKPISNILYTREGMISLFNKYHNLVCSEYACIVYSQKKEKHHFYISPYLCAEINQLQFHELNALDGYPSWYKTSKIQTAFELVSSLNIIPFSKKVQFNAGIKFAGVNFTEEIENNRNEIYNYNVSAIQLMPSISLSYNLFLSSFNPVFELGSYASFLINQNANVKKTYLSVYIENSPFAYRSPIYGFFCSTGANLKIDNKHFVPIRIMYHVAPDNIPPIDLQGSFAYSFITIKVGYTFEI